MPERRWSVYLPVTGLSGSCDIATCDVTTFHGLGVSPGPYLLEENMKSIDKVLTIAHQEIGYLEKRSNSQLDSKTANAGSSNYTKCARDLYPSLQGHTFAAVKDCSGIRLLMATVPFSCAALQQQH